MNLSVPQVLAQLEARVAHHQKQQALHAEQEAAHRDKAAFHQARLEAARTQLEAFRAVTVSAGELLESDKSVAAPPAWPADDIEVNGKRALNRMMARVIENLEPDVTFGATAITRAIQARWGTKLRRQPDPRSVATTLRRWAAAGEIVQVREGRAHHEGLYRKKSA